MRKYLKSILAFIGIYIIFWLIMWFWAIPGTMMTGMSATPYYLMMWLWLLGSILLPIVFVLLLYLEWKKQKERAT